MSKDCPKDCACDGLIGMIGLALRTEIGKSDKDGKDGKDGKDKTDAVLRPWLKNPKYTAAYTAWCRVDNSAKTFAGRLKKFIDEGQSDRAVAMFQLALTHDFVDPEDFIPIFERAAVSARNFPLVNRLMAVASNHTVVSREYLAEIMVASLGKRGPQDEELAKFLTMLRGTTLSPELFDIAVRRGTLDQVRLITPMGTMTSALLEHAFTTHQPHLFAWIVEQSAAQVQINLDLPKLWNECQSDIIREHALRPMITQAIAQKRVMTPVTDKQSAAEFKSAFDFEWPCA